MLPATTGRWRAQRGVEPCVLSISSRDRPQSAPQRYEWPPYPEHLRCIPCGASTRTGTPCKITAIFRNGRCKLHGGKSTGAKTRAGRKRQRDGYRAWLEKQQASKAGRKRTREYASDVTRVGTSTLSELGTSETDRALQSVDGISLRFSGGSAAERP
ncbi:HGGxSTG domain-containing protein [Klebsiella variicola]